MMIDFAQHLQPGSGVWWTQGGGEPTPLVHELLNQAEAIGPLRAFVGLSLDPRLIDALPDTLRIESYGGLGNLRELSRRGRLTVLPCHFSALPRLFAERRLPTDVGIVQVSPPDQNGMCSMGIGVDYAGDAMAHTRILIGEVNSQMPLTKGAPRIPIDRFAITLRTDRPLLEAPISPTDATERAIAHHVATLVEDGDTIEIGVGRIPTAVLAALRGHAALGLHTGMISAPVVDLIQAGIITGEHKAIDPGITVTGAALGDRDLYEAVRDLPIEFRPVSYTHDPSVLSQLRNLVAINSALEVDLTGQVGAEVSRGVHVGAAGGQVDFSRAGAVTGRCSIIALRSTALGESTIQPYFRERHPVTTGRADVDYVVTEHGVASLRGASTNERARRLLAIADPQHHDTLGRAVDAMSRNH